MMFNTSFISLPFLCIRFGSATSKKRLHRLKMHFSHIRINECTDVTRCVFKGARPLLAYAFYFIFLQSCCSVVRYGSMVNSILNSLLERHRAHYLQ